MVRSAYPKAHTVRTSETPQVATDESRIRTPDQRLRVFISSTLGELAEERKAVDTAVRSLRLIPVRFELGARPHRPDDLYRAYLEQSDVFVGIYWQSYGWVAPGAGLSGIEDELVRAEDKPRLFYVKEPAPERDPRLERLLDGIRQEGLATYRHFGSSGELAELVVDDLALLISERFYAGQPVSASLPEGTVSFLVVDVDASTRLATELGDEYRGVIEGFRTIVADAAREEGGALVDAEADGAFCAFPTVEGAALAAMKVQTGLGERAWPGGAAVRARMGIHTGTASRTASGYTGLEVHRAARIGAAANGGQILVSRPAAELLERPRLERVDVVDLGSFALKGLDRTERLFQLLVPGLSEERPAPRARGAWQVHLPSELTVLIGRDREVEEVATMIGAQDTRLVTLTGPGGIGKTRLAIATASTVADAYPDGVFFVPLADARTEEQLIVGVAAALGTRSEGARPLLGTVEETLASRRCLLVLDNFEQMLEARTAVVDLVDRCPGVDVIVTSRAPLRVRSEHEYGVLPLQVPPPGTPPEEAVRASAVRLFLDRARAARPGWDPSEHELASVVEICRRLDGLPLAIELAAPRLRVLDAASLLARLERSLDVVGGGPRDLPPRQQTLTATIKWSVDLLEDSDRILLARLAIFVGSWSLEAAEAVCTDELVPDVLSALERLAEHSLVITHTESAAPIRMRMLATIGEFARARLEESGEKDELQERYVAYFERLVAEQHDLMAGQGARAAMQRLEDDWEDVLAVMRWRYERRDYAELVRTASLSWRFIWLRDRVRESTWWMPDAYAARDELDPPLRGELCRLWGSACYQAGDYEPAKEAIEEAVILLGEWGPPDREAWARTLLGGLLPYHDTDLSHAHAEISHAVTTFRAERNGFGLATSLGMLGVISVLLGNREDAMRELEEGIAVAEELGIPALVGANQTLKALGCLVADEIRSAHRCLDRAAKGPLFLEGAAYWLEAFAAVSLAEGDTIGGATAYGAAESLRARTGIKRWPIMRIILAHRLDPLVDGPPEVAAARFAGSQMTLETALSHLRVASTAYHLHRQLSPLGELKDVRPEPTAEGAAAGT
jgi:predicted ATPase/class 3 adenylate cyclase